MTERRKDHRNRTYLGGKVVFNDRLSVHDCLVRNLSDGGAKLVFDFPTTVPSVFDLVVPRRGESRRAEVKWRTRLEAGVSFVRSAADGYVSIETARRIRRLEDERSALKARVAELSEP